MTDLRMVIDDEVGPPADCFEIGYLTPDGAQVRVPLTDPGSARLESAPPARNFASYEGQRHFPGRWWTTAEEGHVGYESWLCRTDNNALSPVTRPTTNSPPATNSDKVVRMPLAD